MTTKRFEIAVYPGDGIGPEVIDEALRVLDERPVDVRDGSMRGERAMISFRGPRVLPRRFALRMLAVPALMIAITMLGFTLMGDGLRDAFDPQMVQ